MRPREVKRSARELKQRFLGVKGRVREVKRWLRGIGVEVKLKV
jgi:hypothetical protein